MRKSVVGSASTKSKSRKSKPKVEAPKSLGSLGGLKVAATGAAGASAVGGAGGDAEAAKTTTVKRGASKTTGGDKARKRMQRMKSVFVAKSGLEISERHMRGWMYKKGTTGLRRFEKRYFVLRAGYLMFYKAKEAYEAGAPPSQGVALIMGHFKCEPRGDDQLILTPKVDDGSEAILVAEEDDYLFGDFDVEKPRLPKPGRTWTLKAESSEARDRWVARIQEAEPPKTRRRSSMMSLSGATFAKEVWKR